MSVRILLADDHTLMRQGLRHILESNPDFDIVATGAGDVSLTRDQTIMQGAPSCTFRYKFTPR